MDPEPVAVPTHTERAAIASNSAGIESDVGTKSNTRGFIEAAQESVFDLLGDELKDDPDPGVVSDDKQEDKPPELVDRNASIATTIAITRTNR